MEELMNLRRRSSRTPKPTIVEWGVSQPPMGLPRGRTGWGGVVGDWERMNCLLMMQDFRGLGRVGELIYGHREILRYLD